MQRFGLAAVICLMLTANEIFGHFDDFVAQFRGPKGQRGEHGDQGVQGIAGPMGLQGAKGSVGPSGTEGKRGSKGEEGLSGVDGIPGLKGETGPPGARGDKGDVGLKGQQGRTGIKGDQGPQGPAASRGLTGPRGSRGHPGPPGSNGLKGVPGQFQYSVFLPDPDTKLLISMYHQIDSPSPGSLIRDLSGHGNHATVVGQPKFLRHDSGCMNALEFGQADVLNIKSSSSLNIKKQITIETWTAQTASDMGYLMVKQGAYGFPKFDKQKTIFTYLEFENGGFPLFNAIQATSSDGQYHYFALTYDGEVIRYYFDGELVKKLNRRGVIRSSENSIIIGDSGGWHAGVNRKFLGKIASLRVSDRARSPDEILHAFRIGKGILAQTC